MSNPKGGLTKKGLLTVTFICVAVVGGLAAYVKFTPANKVTVEQPSPNHTPRPAPDVTVTRTSSASAGKVWLFVPRYEGDTLKFDSHETDVPADQDPAVYAVNQFLQNSKIADDAARLLSIDLKEGVATLSFNEAFRGGYGTDDEHTLLDGLRNTLGQFPAIEKVKIDIDGKPVESLGNVEITEGLDVIRQSTHGEASTGPQSH